MTSDETVELTLEDMRSMSDEKFAGIFQHRASTIYSLAYGTLGTRAHLHSWMVGHNETLKRVPIELIAEGTVGLARVKEVLEKMAEDARKRK